MNKLVFFLKIWWLTFRRLRVEVAVEKLRGDIGSAKEEIAILRFKKAQKAD